MLETLSIVAYKQPVTRGEIERIRGVKSDHAIAKLMDYDLIEEIGRLDAPDVLYYLLRQKSSYAALVYHL